MSFKEVSINELNFNPFKLIGDDWMLITSGDKSSFNTMTASWGGVGVIWNKKVSFSFIRPQRYTFEFIEENDYYTLSFYGSDYKDALSVCGSTSGRDIDKVQKAGLTPNFSEKSVFFNEASLVLICKKMSAQFIDPNSFCDISINDNYPSKDYHKMYIGEIVKVLVKS